MTPFETPDALITSLKERAEAVTVQGERLYIGTSTGSLLIYELGDDTGASRKLHALLQVTHISLDGSSGRLLDTRKGVARRAIEQLGYVKDINSLVVLAGTHHFLNLYLMLSTMHRLSGHAIPFARLRSTDFVDQGENSVFLCRTYICRA